MAPYENLADVVQWLQDLKARVAELAVKVSGVTATRTVWGRVNSDGTISGGSGDFSVLHNGPGDYTITWSVPFSAPPAAQLTVGAIAAVRLVKESALNSPNAATFRVATLDTSGTVLDTQFQFTATGPA